MTPRVAAVVLHYNSPDQAVRCARSLSRSRGVAVQTLVLDNASAEPNYARLKVRLRHAQLARSPVNRGYAGGMNYALRLVSGWPKDYSLIVTQDVVVGRDTVSALVSAMAAEGSIGIVGPSVYRAQRPRTLVSAGCYADPTSLQVGHYEELLGSTPYEVDWVDGCCMLLHPRLVEETGGFREDYFMYYEDNDLCQRARRLGWKVVVSPGAKVWNEFGEPPRSPAYYYHMSRNAYVYWKTNHGIGFWPVALRLGRTLPKEWLAAGASLMVPRLRIRGRASSRLALAYRMTRGTLLGSLAYLLKRNAPGRGLSAS